MLFFDATLDFWDDLRHFRLNGKESILPKIGWVALAHQFYVEVLMNT